MTETLTIEDFDFYMFPPSRLALRLLFWLERLVPQRWRTAWANLTYGRLVMGWFRLEGEPWRSVTLRELQRSIPTRLETP